MTQECWIPDLFPSYDGSSNWVDYERELYKAFTEDFIDHTPTFFGQPIHIRTDPRFDGKEEGFWHLTCRDYGKSGRGPESRDPEPSRYERIRWPRAFVENYMLCGSHAVEDCNGVLVYLKEHKSRTSKKFKRYALFSEEDRYILILEHRPKQQYFFLITAYYIEEDYKIKSCLREWERHKVKF